MRDEAWLVLSFATCLCFFCAGHSLFNQLSHPLGLAVIAIWLLTVILGSALSVVRHADQLAIRLGEPYGTLILTLSVTFIEVMSITAVMLHGSNNPTLTRDTLFSVVMIILNGMVGLSLLLGGLRHREQHYNLQGANAYLSVIIPLIVLTLVLPDFTQATAGPTLSIAQSSFVALVAVGLYMTFLAMQSGRHRGYFTLGDEVAGHASHAGSKPPLVPHVILLFAYMAPLVFLAEQLAHPVDYIIETLGAPDALGGLVIAILVATPEATGAVRAAMANHVQRSLNIFLGSVLSTIGLTIPAMIVVSYITGRSLILGVEHSDEVMLLVTLAVSIVTFASGRTNIIQGVVHLILFGAFLLLLIQG
ncbi:hypothetical protein ACELLULO517_13475 [Acidisoma cellulosilytica]|uniref:Sodium/calcium exchanger membrane region domain-containing protein n=1 Tax=Acidisoma cellulosilyticum TaxID=2802395 RepID=A0A964E4F7_9PROT|nr:hypothetical protein [Acidisoma cellulosilyticum]MCB8881252.1 hypothetical protein [Acidisoma cellulosilyticum]